MEVVISGSRSIKNYALVGKAIDESGWNVTHIRHGGAGGVDQGATLTAAKRNIPWQSIPARWDDFTLPKVIRKFDHRGREYNAAAGMVRNEQMIQQVGTDGGLIAVWDGKSPGTANCIAHAVLNNVPVFIYIPHHSMPAAYHLNVNDKTREFAKDIIELGYKKATTKRLGHSYARY